jgi:hypothetical protein
MLFRLVVLCCAAFFAAAMNLGFAVALENENLLVALPKGYKVGHQAKNGKAIITELIPEKEVITNWTEMVTVQIFFGLGHVTPDQFRQGMEKTWSTACPGSQFGVVNKGTERGYPTLTWLQNCPLNKVTRKPEITWLKAIQGRDSLYVVQKAFKFSPTPDQVKTWVAFLQKVSVCDTRLTDRKCPFK